MITFRRTASLALTFLVFGTGATAVWAVTHGGPVANSSPSLPPPFIATPTAALLNGAPAIEEGTKALTADPPAAGLVDATLRADVAALIATFPAAEGVCDEFGTRGATKCETMGLPPGTRLKLYDVPNEALSAFWIDEDTARSTVGYLLGDRNPTLALVARREDDGAYLVVISVDPQPDRLFPEGRVVGGDVGAIYMVVGKSGGLLHFEGRNVSAPPLEPIQNDIRYGNHTYRILGVSDGFSRKEAQFHDDREAFNKQSPP